MKKKLLPTNDLCIQFTEDELDELNIKPGDKFDFKLQDDGSIKLDKYVNVELEIEEWPIEMLRHLIKESCERDVSVNEVISDLLKSSLDNLDFATKKTQNNVLLNEAVLPTAWNNNLTTNSSDVQLSTATSAYYIYNDNPLITEGVNPQDYNYQCTFSGHEF